MEFGIWIWIFPNGSRWRRRPRPTTLLTVAESSDTLGIIAGNRSLPLLFAKQARGLGVKRLVAVAFEGETEPELAKLVDDIIWLRVPGGSPDLGLGGPCE